MLAAIRIRGRSALAPAVLAAAKSPHESVRLAAARALSTVGDVTALPALVELAAAEGPVGQTARQSLEAIYGPKIDEQIFAALRAEKDPVRRAAWIGVLQVAAARRGRALAVERGRGAGPRGRNPRPGGAGQARRAARHPGPGGRRPENRERARPRRGRADGPAGLPADRRRRKAGPARAEHFPGRRPGRPPGLVAAVGPHRRRRSPAGRARGPGEQGPGDLRGGRAGDLELARRRGRRSTAPPGRDGHGSGASPMGPARLRAGRLAARRCKQRPTSLQDSSRPCSCRRPTKNGFG